MKKVYPNKGKAIKTSNDRNSFRNSQLTLKDASPTKLRSNTESQLIKQKSMNRSRATSEIQDEVIEEQTDRTEKRRQNQFKYPYRSILICVLTLYLLTFHSILSAICFLPKNQRRNQQSQANTNSINQQVIGAVIAFYIVLYVVILILVYWVYGLSQPLLNLRKGKYNENSPSKIDVHCESHSTKHNNNQSKLSGFPENPSQIQRTSKYLQINKGNTICCSKWCATCQVFMNDRLAHCRICDKCFLGQDHHCDWLGCCITSMNYRFFVWFLVVLCFQMICYLANNVIVISNSLQIAKQAHGFTTQTIAIICLGIFGFVQSILVGIYSLQLLVFHFWLISKGISTRQYYQNTNRNQSRCSFKLRHSYSYWNQTTIESVQLPSFSSALQQSPSESLSKREKTLQNECDQNEIYNPKRLKTKEDFQNEESNQDEGRTQMSMLGRRDHSQKKQQSWIENSEEEHGKCSRLGNCLKLLDTTKFKVSSNREIEETIIVGHNTNS